MPRYIDADLLLEQLSKKKSEVAKGRYIEGFNDAIMRVRSMVSSAKTVDVVPKGEVDELSAIIADHKATEGLLEELYANAKVEITREIFEEIDQIFRRQYELCSQTDFKLLEPILQGERFTINEMWHKVAELKKKYT